MRKSIMALAAISLSVSGLARADVPTSDEAKKVFDFIDHGQGQGIVIVDARLCNEIPKTGDHKSECTEELKDGIPAGTKVYVWLQYLVPKGDTISDVSVAVKEGDKVRETKDLGKLEGHGYLARTWTVFTAKKAGTWTASLTQGDKTLKDLPIKVVEK